MAAHGRGGDQGIPHISEHYRRFIEVAVRSILATAGPEGLDCTPRGDPAGFVRGSTSAPSCCPTARATTASTTCATSSATARIALLFLTPHRPHAAHQRPRRHQRRFPSSAPRSPWRTRPAQRDRRPPPRASHAVPQGAGASHLGTPAGTCPRVALPSSGTMMKALQEGSTPTPTTASTRSASRKRSTE